MSENLTPYIFFSYAHKDEKVVLPIFESFRDAGYHIWYDDNHENGIQPGGIWAKTLAERIEEAEFVISMISNAYLESENCLDELHYALTKKARKNQFLVFIEDVTLPEDLEFRTNRIQNVKRSHYDSVQSLVEEVGKTEGISICRNIPAAEPAKKDKSKLTDYTAIQQAEQLHSHKGTSYAAAETVKKVLHKGDICVFGSYPQGVRGEVKPIEWRVLAVEGNRALLISRYGLDCRQFHKNRTTNQWKDCTLHSWLNDDFYQKAFNSQEQQQIQPTTLPDAGTTDRVFLLSEDEAKKYFTDNNDRRCAPTAYAVAQGAFQDADYTTADGVGCCWWWLRSSTVTNTAGYVFTSGIFCNYNTYSTCIGVRPALWVEIPCEQRLNTEQLNSHTGTSTVTVESVKQELYVGDTYVFGNYPQGANGEVKPIKWRVLAVEGDKALLISRYGLDCQKFHKDTSTNKWKDCTLHRWLNEGFYRKAFNGEEQKKIQQTPLKDAGTTDKVFLLSTGEAKKYFTDDDDRRCAPTAYAVAQGVWQSSNNTTADGVGCCWWWLRSPGYGSNYASNVDGDGYVYGGDSVNYSDNAIRPALWVKIS